MLKIFLIFCLVSFSFGSEIKILKVYDGDTITILINNKIERLRLYGIDTPEIKQEYGKEAKDALYKMCKNKKVRLELKGVDIYKRQLGILYCGRVNVNKTLLRDGYAWSYNNWNKILEIKAKKEKKGLWASENPINPKEFRDIH